MENVIYLSELYDYYKNLLTTKQQDYFENYYFDNLTMEEIAENNNVSKNAVSKTLIEVKDKLNEYEELLKLKQKKDKIIDVLSPDQLEKIIEFI